MMGPKFELPLGAIIGIAVGGALVLLVCSVSVAICVARGKDRRERAKFENEPTKSWSKRRSRTRSFNPFVTQQAVNIEMIDKSPVLKQRNWKTRARFSPQQKLSPEKKLFRISFIESWPLTTLSSSADLASGIFPNESARRSCVAPPGYELPPPPKKVHLPNPVPGPFEESTLSDSSPRYKGKGRRSTSESHLSSILRSTSQRLKGNDSDLTRTLTTIAKRPTPERRRTSEFANESCEVLIERASVGSRPSSLTRMVARSAGLVPPTNRHRLSLHGDSTGSEDDSLLGRHEPEIITATLLSSTHRHSRKISAHSDKVRVSSISSVNIQATMYEDIRASGEKNTNVSTLIIPHRISLAGDPFISTVKSAKPKHLVGPRPMLSRKETSGESSTGSRRTSSTAPLADISGNSISPRLLHHEQQHSPSSSSAEQNSIFSYSPKEMLQTYSRPSSESPPCGMTKQRGHKRSKVVRISGLSRPTSVCAVHEESEGESSPYKLTAPALKIQAMEPTKSSRNNMPRPPSIPTFDPVVTLPGRSFGFDPRSEKSLRQASGYSPTLSMCKLYSEGTETSRSLASRYQSQSQLSNRLLIRSATQSQPHPTHIQAHARRHGRNFSEELSLSSGANLFSFPSFPSLAPSRDESPQASENSPANYQRRSPPRSPSKSIAFPLPPRAAEPLPPMLTSPSTTLTTPGHLTGPRPLPEPMKMKGMMSLGSDREGAVGKGVEEMSIKKSIRMLRRMNSEISNYDTIASLAALGVGVGGEVIGEREIGKGDREGNRGTPGREHRRTVTMGVVNGNGNSSGSGSGTKHYLSIGSTPTRFPRAAGLAERDIATDIGEEDEKDQDEDSSGKGKGKEGLGIQGFGFIFPTLSSVGSMGGTPPEVRVSLPAATKETEKKQSGNNNTRGGERIMYWSKYAPRQSRDLDDSPTLKIPPNIKLAHHQKMEIEDDDHDESAARKKAESGGLFGEGLVGKDEERAEWGEEFKRPDSLGLYDARGFLIDTTSPNRSPERSPNPRDSKNIISNKNRRGVKEMEMVCEDPHGDGDVFLERRVSRHAFM